jgi:hypothetical protein
LLKGPHGLLEGGVEPIVLRSRAARTVTEQAELSQRGPDLDNVRTAVTSAQQLHAPLARSSGTDVSVLGRRSLCPAGSQMGDDGPCPSIFVS